MAQLPTKDQILAWISENPHAAAKRDIAKAFGLKGAARIDLKRMLKELEAEGHLEKRKKTYRDAERLPPVAVLKLLAPDDLGDQFAQPLEWSGDGPEPRILFSPRATDPALGAGDRILARLQEVQGEDHHYVARLIRKIGTNPANKIGFWNATPVVQPILIENTDNAVNNLRDTINGVMALLQSVGLMADS